MGASVGIGSANKLGELCRTGQTRVNGQQRNCAERIGELDVQRVGETQLVATGPGARQQRRKRVTADWGGCQDPQRCHDARGRHFSRTMHAAKCEHHLGIEMSGRVNRMTGHPPARRCA